MVNFNARAIELAHEQETTSAIPYLYSLFSLYVPYNRNWYAIVAVIIATLNDSG